VGGSLGQSNQAGGLQPRANQSIVFRNDLLRWVIETARPLSNKVSRLLPEGVKQWVRDQIYIPRDQRMKNLFTADYIQDFIRDYYAEDIALYKKVGYHDQVAAS